MIYITADDTRVVVAPQRIKMNLNDGDTVQKTTLLDSLARSCSRRSYGLFAYNR